MEIIQDGVIERQLKDITPEFLLRCNPHARLLPALDGQRFYVEGEKPTFCDYMDWLEKFLGRTYPTEREANEVRNAVRYGVHQLIDMADMLGLLEEWGKDRRPSLTAWYAAQRLDGASHKWADMTAHQTPPGCMTDREFLEGHCNGNQFEGQEIVGDAYKKMAAAAGVDVKGAVYINGLAAYAGDPKAWVRGRGDVEKLCNERGYNADGAVRVRNGSRESAPDVDVADDIVADRVLSKLEANPGLALRDPAEVFHEAKSELKPHWAAAA